MHLFRRVADDLGAVVSLGFRFASDLCGAGGVPGYFFNRTLHFVDSGGHHGNGVGLAGHTIVVVPGGSGQFGRTRTEIATQILNGPDHALQVFQYLVETSGQFAEIILDRYRNPLSQVPFALGNVVELIPESTD